MAFDSLFTGISGLNAYQTWIDTISNNIANTATTGFKGQRVTFADLFYQQLLPASGPTNTNGGINPQSVGLGVKVNTIDTEFAQGGLQTTGINTDLALNGDGFFILRNNNGTPIYTRDGAFSLNQNGLLFDPATGFAVQGFTANKNGQVTNTGTPSNIQIPVGLEENATATGAGTKVGPQGDQNFDVAFGGNLDQTQWTQAFLAQVGGSANAGTPVVTSTTIFDSLGNPHKATITYTPDAAGSTAATAATANGGGDLTAAATVAPATSQNDTITVTSTAAGNYTITDTLGNNQTAAAGATVTVGGATFTLTNPAPAAGAVSTVTVTSATNGLPKTVDNAQGNAVVPATRWAVSVSFADGTSFSTITAPGTINAAGVATGPTFGSGTSGTVGFAYFDQNGQFINSSSIEGVAAGQSIGANATAFLHSTGNAANTNQGNQLNVLAWGANVGNNALAPTAGAVAPVTGPIGFDFSNDASVSGSSIANVVSQNGFAAGVLSNITVQQDGSVVGAFTNGQQKTLAQVAVATFQNEGGLARVGGNGFQQTAASGLAQVGTAGNGRFGQIVGGALEQSNVSLASEFTNLIVAQRAFEANTRGISTADQNLQTIIHLQATEN